MLSFFPRGVLDEILNLIGSVSEEFPFSCSIVLFVAYFLHWMFWFKEMMVCYLVDVLSAVVLLILTHHL